MYKITCPKCKALYDVDWDENTEKSVEYNKTGGTFYNYYSGEYDVFQFLCAKCNKWSKIDMTENAMFELIQNILAGDIKDV